MVVQIVEWVNTKMSQKQQWKCIKKKSMGTVILSVIGVWSVNVGGGIKVVAKKTKIFHKYFVGLSPAVNCL